MPRFAPRYDWRVAVTRASGGKGKLLATGRGAVLDCGRHVGSLAFSPCGRRWRVAPDEGFSPRAGTARRVAPSAHRCAMRDPSSALRAPSPARGEGDRRERGAREPRASSGRRWLWGCRIGLCIGEAREKAARVSVSPMASSMAKALSGLLLVALPNRKTVVPFPGNALELPLAGREAIIARIPEQRAAIGGEILDHLAVAGDEAVLRGAGKRGGLSGGEGEEGEG